MPAFAYRALDSGGKPRRGVIEANTAAGARRALREQALLPVAVNEHAGAARPVPGGDVPPPSGASAAAAPAAPRVSFSLGRGRAISGRRLSVATRQLSTLIGSHVRIEEALRLVAQQSDAPLVSTVLLDVRSAVLEGASFARALSRHPRHFPNFYTASIQAGEQSGRLAEVLVYLADFVEARQTANQKVVLALIYPALLAVVSGGMMVLMMVFVVPNIVQVFTSRGADLPFVTRALIGLSNFLNGFGLYLLLALLVGGFLAARELRDPRRRSTVDRFLATRRPFRRFTRQANAARFSATLATLVLSAVPLLDALIAAAAVVPNRFVRAQAQGVADRVREGDGVARAMGEAGIFPSMLVAIVASGEAGGTLGPALQRAAAELDRELQAQVQVIVSLVEPLVLLVMGGIVLLMVLAILMPIVGLNDLAVS